MAQPSTMHGLASFMSKHPILTIIYPIFIFTYTRPQTYYKLLIEELRWKTPEQTWSGVRNAAHASWNTTMAHILLTVLLVVISRYYSSYWNQDCGSLSEEYLAHVQKLAAGPFAFQKLPQELRDKIYRMSCGNTIRANANATDTRTYYRRRPNGYYNLPPGTFKSLSVVSKAVRAEVFTCILGKRFIVFDDVATFDRFIMSSMFERELYLYIRKIRIHVYRLGVQQLQLSNILQDLAMDNEHFKVRFGHPDGSVRREKLKLLTMKTLELDVDVSDWSLFMSTEAINAARLEIRGSINSRNWPVNFVEAYPYEVVVRSVFRGGLYDKTFWHNIINVSGR